MSIDFLLVNGDSYSDNDTNESYSNTLGSLVGVPTLNIAKAGSSNNRIIRTTLEQCLGLKAKGKTPLVVIGFSFFTREEVWHSESQKYLNKIRDFEGSKFVTREWLMQDNNLSDEMMNRILDENINSQIFTFATNLLLLVNTLENLNFKYLIFSAANNKDFRNFESTLFNKSFLGQELSKNNNIIDLFNFNIPLWAKSNSVNTTATGHLYEEGHKKFGHYLYNKLIQDGQIK